MLRDGRLFGKMVEEVDRMQKCNFCGRWFKNKQAVRAHLKYCQEYRELRLNVKVKQTVKNTLREVKL